MNLRQEISKRQSPEVVTSLKETRQALRERGDKMKVRYGICNRASGEIVAIECVIRFHQCKLRTSMYPARQKRVGFIHFLIRFTFVRTANSLETKWKSVFLRPRISKAQKKKRSLFILPNFRILDSVTV